MGHKHSKEQILDNALAVALDDGLSQLTFGRLAKRLGISDRIIVYYFPTKADLISEVITAMGFDLQEALAAAFATPANDHRQMVARAWPVLTTPASDRVFALFFEANGLAAVGLEPYATIVPELINAWIDWATAMVDAAVDDPRAEAEAAVAMIDGLVLMRLLAGAESADRAAAVLIGT